MIEMRPFPPCPGNPVVPGSKEGEGWRDGLEPSEAEAERVWEGEEKREHRESRSLSCLVVLPKTCSTVHPKTYNLVRVTFFGLGVRALQRSKFHIGVSMERDRDILLERWNLLGKGSKDNIHFICLKSTHPLLPRLVKILEKPLTLIIPAVGGLFKAIHYLQGMWRPQTDSWFIQRKCDGPSGHLHPSCQSWSHSLL